jgi:hypothetical protein
MLKTNLALWMAEWKNIICLGRIDKGEENSP